ncbi:hypothetical protein GCM10023354_13160 [Garicola koreensis]|uniref:hypothetical protein n=1 Tax=Garicola koreensis TaxID=1262554 RepID=UPI0031EAD5C5
MSTTSQTASVQLLRAQAHDDGFHSSDQLADRVHRGELLRVRRGVYIDAAAWLQAPTWRRHEIATAAEALKDDFALFCRETALRLHGLPVLNMPQALQVRTAGRGRVATVSPAPMTGQLTAAQFLRRYAARGPQTASGAEARLSTIGTKFVEPALPAGMSRAELRSATSRGTDSNPRTLLPSDALPDIRGPKVYRVEPAGLAVVDTVSRMSFVEAVVVLDAVKARADIDVEPWLPYLRTKRQHQRWQRAWAFADPRAESALESESRALLHKLGFPPPTLQKVVQTRLGQFRLDMCWEDQRVAAEVDGRAKYFDPQYAARREAHDIYYAEKQRREAIEEDGWHMVRWGKQQLLHPEQLVRRLARCGVVPVPA